MEWFSSEWFVALFSIIIIDLVLAGDNAIVIGMAARNLDKSKQKLVIWLGTGGAVLVRVLATFVVVWLLKIPGLMLIGGLFLLYIAYKLLVEDDGKDHGVKPAASLWAAIRTIIIADAAMGLDNVLAIAGASHGHMGLVIIGLAVSVPIVVWGSMLIIRLINRFPALLYVGSGVLAYTAGKMLVDERLVHAFFERHAAFKYALIAAVVAAVLMAGKLTVDMRRRKAQEARGESAGS
jgi:YjbE family integral membrane protein